MKTAYNFNAGPCVLPKEAIESTIAAIRDFDNTGIGLLEISHRTPGWERTMEETRQLWRDLLGIPAEYEILFLGGGASTGFMDVPANLLNKKAAYLQTGVWAKKAAKEAKNFGETVIVASSEDKTYSYIPKGWTVPADADYFHITTNNTIYGTEIRKDFAANEINNVMLVADMSSDIMSRPVDVKKYGLERRPCRCHLLHRPQGHPRQDHRPPVHEPPAHHGGLPHPRRRRGQEHLHVQHSPGERHLRHA